MSFVSRIKRAVGFGWLKDDNDQAIDNEDYLFNLFGSIPHGVLNGSFENLDGSDPANITVTPTGDGSYAIDTDAADTVHGYRSLLMTANSQDDTVVVEWDDYTPCEAGERIAVDFSCKLSAATLGLKVEILWWYYNGAAFVAATTPDETLYDASTGNPTSWQTFKFQAVAPSGANPAKYYTLRFTFSSNVTTATGTCHLDNIASRVYHGFVPANIGDAEQPLDSQTTAANTNYTVTPATAMSTLFAVEKPKEVVIFFTESGGTGTSVDQINSVGGRRADANGGSTPKLCSELKNYRVILDNDGSFIWRSEDAGWSVDFYLVGYYV